MCEPVGLSSPSSPCTEQRQGRQTLRGQRGAQDPTAHRAAAVHREIPGGAGNRKLGKVGLWESDLRRGKSRPPQTHLPHLKDRLPCVLGLMLGAGGPETKIT